MIKLRCHTDHVEEAGIEPRVLAEFGLDHRARVEPIRDRPDHRVCRVHDRHGTYVLKVWRGEDAPELANYRLLARLGVPTIQVVAATGSALLLEDLGGTGARRLATEDDLADPAVITALATWYRRLHDAGAPPGNWAVPWEHEHLTPDALRRTGRRLGLDHEPAWISAVESLDPVLEAARRLPQTLVHNDFHVTNLALVPGAAIMIDFELLRIGTRAGDLRNVTGQLGPAARETFLASYGPVPTEEQVIDAPLAVLGALAQFSGDAARLPRWVRFLVAEVRDGGLTRKLAAVAELH
ncbi:aminoglycoside phosphotransferase family protein [Microlunatus sp. GCM10028923]|uniref:aminoglycoside phosphotransferase family protein n=1 Tax=Microlunatus sp. GCM10028923 TaxID=3273400 RepID=UPI003608E9D0